MSETGNFKGSLVRELKTQIAALLGIIIGVAGFFIVNIGRIEFRAALAEFFAIIFGVSAVHFSYDLFIRRTWLKETEENVAVAVKLQWYRSSTLHRLGLERGLEHLQGNQIRNMLAREKKEVRVLKTWFPEDNLIQAGLEQALAGKAQVDLYLCKPDSQILKIRCESTKTQTFNNAQHKIYDAVKLVYKSRFAGAKPKNNASVTIYDCWPGVPIIKCGPRFFIGFYFRDTISPMSPWLEVKEESAFGKLLDHQFKSIEKPEEPELNSVPADDSKKWLKVRSLTLNNSEILLKWLDAYKEFK